MKRHLLIGVLLAICSAVNADSAAAQYFGQNKVQYKTFDFEILKTDHFDVYFYPEERRAAELSARLAERWHARLSRVLGTELVGRQPLILYASHPDFEQTNVLPGGIGESTGGVTESLRRRIVLPLAGPLAETDHVIGHELVHAFQYNITAGRDGTGALVVGGTERLPLWFIEGMAEYLSVGPEDPHTAMWIRDAVAENRLPKDLDDPDYFPYRWGQAWWAYVTGRFGDAAVGNLLRAAKAAGDVDEAIEQILGVELKQLMTDWHEMLRSTYAPSINRAAPASEFGKLLVGEARLGGELNVSPAISPDGKRVAFLSERSLFSIDVYLADAQTGRIVRRLTTTDTDPHVTSLQFIRSAGAWSPDGARLALSAIEEGRPSLLIVNGENGDRVSEIELPQLHEVFNPAWSPDGRTIVFSAISGGLSDLFSYDLTANQLRRLSDDPFAELQPAWSPDGRTIVFATDRFTSNLDELKFGEYRLAAVSADGTGLRELPSIGRGKAINPQWSPDGSRVYYLSDANGATNVFSLDPRSGAIRQITNLRTGVSGITASSPALSAATRADRLVVSAYERGAYRVYRLESAEVLEGRAAVDTPRVVAVLPPVQRQSVEVARLVENPGFGLPRREEFPVNDYRATLGLNYVSQPTFAAGVDRFGTYGGGGLALFWSDMLGDHNLVTAVQVDSSLNRNFSLKDTAALVGYQNAKHRWNWGASVEQVPYLSGGVATGFDEIDGDTVLVEQLFISREINQAFTGLVSYPFSRAQRVDFSGGVRRISFERRVETDIFSPTTGELLGQQSLKLPAPGALNLAQASAALVFDNAFYGATSPVLGQRYRLEVAPMLGTINFTNVLADYRRYFMPAQFYTIAARVMHYGRYGGDAESGLLFPLFIGYPNLVRGYDVGSFSADECPANTGSCAAFDRLVGSRIAVANLELRFPLFRPLGLGRNMYGPLPLEFALFADSGIAWTGEDAPDVFGGSRRPVWSVGAALRANVFGFTVVQFDFVRPLDRPRKGWMFQFSLSPGF
ncbi:MAG TPA: BamA/TamA family outer membrane protein [Vicinamibacterales bacterium]|nr:BamA/TamA family outer membrane protein [Vicinamibacterales bacterium]